MKKYVIFLIGCFLIGFVAAAFGLSMSKSIENFLIVCAFDFCWALIVYRKDLVKNVNSKL
jgi:hypothetical protein